MLRLYKPKQNDHYSVTALIWTVVRKLSRIYKIKKSEFEFIMILHTFQVERNTLITYGGLNKVWEIDRRTFNITVKRLIELGFIARVTPPHNITGAKKFYDITGKGIKLIDHFSNLLSRDTAKFKEGIIWKPVNKAKKNIDYFESIGVLKAKN